MKEMGKLLKGRNDEYGGVIVHMDDGEPMDTPTFVSSLSSSIALWKQQGKKGVWFRLPIQQANLVEAAVQIAARILVPPCGASLFDARYWIPNSAHTLPENATHRLGIGAFLINQNREVLVVQEKGGQHGGTGLWKLPNGAVDEGEDIYAAAVREVKEETGIDSEFMEILAFSHAQVYKTKIWQLTAARVEPNFTLQIHKSFFEKSDLFFLCMLRPLSFDIQKQDQEIEAAKWMPFEEYAAQPFVQKYEFLRYLHDICKAKMDGNYTGFSPIPTTTYSVQKSYLYLNSAQAPNRQSKL